MNTAKLKFSVTDTLPKEFDTETVYHLRPQSVPKGFFEARTDRNIGWITPEEQAALRTMTVGVAGCGGMGGQLAQVLIRLGVGEVRIADIEQFDVSNINRQFGATRGTVGVAKAWATARMLRTICDDTTLIVYPQGITERTVEQFVSGCTVLCDELEFWAIGARTLLHHAARRAQVTVFNCNTVAFGTRLFQFEPDGYTMEECLQTTVADASALQKKIEAKTASETEIRSAMECVLRGLVPELPSYTAVTDTYNDREIALERLFTEGRASIISTNPSLATGFLADHVLMHLLQSSQTKRTWVKPPKAPGYLYFDALQMIAKVVNRTEV